MEEKENSKNTRAFYLTLAVVLAVIAILIIATVAARRSTENPPIDESSSSGTESETNPTISETDTLPEFSLPVDGEISFDFSDSVPVFSPTMDDWRTHLGVDVLAELGSEVFAVADGTVTNVWDDPFMGTCVSVEHSGNAVSIYKNLAKDVGDGIVIGCSVKAGDVIGSVGETAMNEIAQEPHLHFEMTVKGETVDPKNHLKFPTKDIVDNNESQSESESSSAPSENA
ncbi:MAG: peptidoglycan DD-metalloendopeptidase family protein [Clostridia bacterium]|nr:peptidoglycan DD-metalloendopeptidase family protein [Clostridia bacterium]